MPLSWFRPALSIPEVTTIEEFDALLARDITVVFKHSPSCPVSWMAHREVSRFREIQPEVAVYLVSVRQRRDVARHISERTGVRHESPQILVLRGSQTVGTTSHDGVTAEWLTTILQTAPVATSL